MPFGTRALQWKGKLSEVHHNLFPQYEYAYTTWWKWFKIIVNLATAALGVLAELFAVFKFGSTAVDAIIPVFTVGRILEAAKDVVLLFTTGSTIWYKGFSTPEHAVRFDRIAKYVTCLTISLVLSATSFYGFGLRPDAIGHWWLLLLGLVGGVDFMLGLYIVILDECVREHYLARERPNEFQVDVNMEEGDPFNEGEDSAAAVGLSTRPPIAERFPTVVQMKDKRAKEKLFHKIEDDFGLDPHGIEAFQGRPRDDQEDDRAHLTQHPGNDQA